MSVTYHIVWGFAKEQNQQKLTNWESMEEQKQSNSKKQAYHIELEKIEDKEYDCKAVVQEKTKLKNHSKENCEKRWE